MAALPDFFAYNHIPVPVPRFDATHVIAINGRCGVAPDVGLKGQNQIVLAQEWVANGNTGRLGSRQRFDVVFAPVNGGFYDAGWDPSYIARIPLADYNLMSAIWQSQGFTVNTEAGVDQDWLAAVWAADTGTAPCPYSSFIDWSQKILYVNRYVLDVRQSGALDWVVSSALSFRSQLVDYYGLPFDLWESTLKSRFWPYPQDDQRTPLSGFGAGAITDTPFGAGEFEEGIQNGFRALFAEGFDFIINDYPIPGEDKGGWLDADVFNTLLGDWRVVQHPEVTNPSGVRPPIRPNPRRPVSKTAEGRMLIVPGPKRDS